MLVDGLRVVFSFVRAWHLTASSSWSVACVCAFLSLSSHLSSSSFHPPAALLELKPTELESQCVRAYFHYYYPYMRSSSWVSERARITMVEEQKKDNK